jgi:hypothetical protein
LLGHSDGEEDTATEVETLLWTNYRPQFAPFVKQNMRRGTVFVGDVEGKRLVKDYKEL